MPIILGSNLLYDKVSIMKKISVNLILLIIGLTAIISCKSPTESESNSILISGIVVFKGDDSPISNAIVRVIDSEPEIIVFTGANGTFSFEYDSDESVTLELEVRKEGFLSITSELLAIPGRDIEIPALKLETPDGEAPPVQPGVSGPPSNIVLLQASEESIRVIETGGNENATFTFEIRDGNGQPVDIDNSVEVRFSFGGHPDGGEFLHPESVETDENGHAVTTLTSGTIAGVVQVVAEFTKPDGTLARSKPVNLSIHSGLPDADHFAIASTNFNMPGNILNVSNTILAVVGDKYGNMVETGTAVYFTTTGGIVQGSSLTDDLGNASVSLITAPPFPTHPQFGPGFATVSARTADENNQTIETSTLVLFSLSPRINASPNVVEVENGGSQTFFYSVSDIHGNPMVAGTTITVEVEGENLEVIGDVSITLPDTQVAGPNTTEFQFTLSDSDPENELVKPVQITITSSGPNGETSRTITGTTKLLGK